MDAISTSNELSEHISAAALKIEDKAIAWRRDIHQNPELSYQEALTAALAATALGYEVKTGVGITGVLGVLTGGKPGGVVALRADIIRVSRPPNCQTSTRCLSMRPIPSVAPSSASPESRTT